MNDVVVKKARSNKPAMVKVSLRIPAEVLEFYKAQSPHFTKAMRDALSQIASSK
jgi:hypothetical protein